MKISYLFALLFCLSACINNYHAWNGSTGYKEKELNPDKWEITYSEGASQDIQQARYHAALRCSELAELKHYQKYKFTITTENHQTITAPIGGSFISGLNGSMSVNEEHGHEQANANNESQKEYLIPKTIGICELSNPQLPKHMSD